LDSAGTERQQLRGERVKQLVLDDEGQAQIALSKLRASCERVMLDAQTKIGRELALRFDQLESTLARSLNEAMRPIET
ncbi:hypothetical protein WGW96_08645, partial [Campylobacter jejuni]